MVLGFDAPSLCDGLTTPRGIVLMAASAVAGLVSLWLLIRRRFVAARPNAAVAIVTVLWGWALANTHGCWRM
jgi:cytochrome d ubiquinol oxidase subunit II